MPETKQAGRPLTITTPLGENKLLLRGFTGRESISQLFNFRLDLLAENKTEVAFDQLLGAPMTIHVPLPPDGSKQRHFNGICVRFSQGERDKREETFTAYEAEIVPQFWLLSRKAQSRIFQHMTVPDILKKVLSGLDVAYELQGTFHPRNFCVQYRESDFNFASRLMEEEGIYYYFKHTDGSHKMLVANGPDSHVDVQGESTIKYQVDKGGFLDDDRISFWVKMQELRSGKYTLWDHSFELPHKHLEADKKIQATVTVGTATHKLQVGGNDKLELYDWPGEYAQRFDGVDKGGGDRPADLQKIFEDNKRTAEIRMQQEALESLVIRGRSNCRQMTSGHKFTLQKHFTGDGPYVLTSVQHAARGAGEFRGGYTGAFRYENQFECIPKALPFRTPQTTPKPVVQGSQSAVVVGPPGEEIFTDKYGRVKVQFHWDREGKSNADSSCWLRVASHWAGKQWGMIHIPRIGQEVLVDFLEGDPDQPIVVGSVYNAEMMPPYALPQDKTQSGIKTRSSLGGNPETFNEICFEDKKGHELVYLRAEKDLTIAVENCEAHWVGSDREKTIGHDETTHVEHDRTETVDNNETITILGDRRETVAKNEVITIGINRTEMVGSNEAVTIGASREETVGAAETITVGGARAVTVGGAQTYAFGGALAIAVGAGVSVSVSGKSKTEIGGEENSTIGKDRKADVSGDDKLSIGKKFELAAGDEITLVCGAASITMKKDGKIEIKGSDVTVDGMGKVAVKAMGDTSIKGATVRINGDGMAMVNAPLVKVN